MGASRLYRSVQDLFAAPGGGGEAVLREIAQGQGKRYPRRFGEWKQEGESQVCEGRVQVGDETILVALHIQARFDARPLRNFVVLRDVPQVSRFSIKRQSVSVGTLICPPRARDAANQIVATLVGRSRERGTVPFVLPPNHAAESSTSPPAS